MYCNSITNLKFLTLAKMSSFKNPHIKIDLLCRGPKYIELLHSKMNLNTISLPWQGKANKLDYINKYRTQVPTASRPLCEHKSQQYDQVVKLTCESHPFCMAAITTPTTSTCQVGPQISETQIRSPSINKTLNSKTNHSIKLSLKSPSLSPPYPLFQWYLQST